MNLYINSINIPRIQLSLRIIIIFLGLTTVIPYCHAIAAMNLFNVNVEDFIPIWFRRSTYEETYQSIIFLVNGKVLWERTPYPNVHPLHKRILSGRPKKKRRLEEWELRKDNTHISKGGHRKNVAYVVKLTIIGTIVQISL